MKTFYEVLKNDFKTYLKYNIIQSVVILSLLFAGIMAFAPGIDPLLLIYITVFVLPVIIFSIGFYIEREDKTIIPSALCECNSVTLISAKITTALILLLIPFVLYMLVMTFVLNFHINVILFLLIYILGAVLHIVVGVVLAIISKSTSIMSASYIAYIVLFSAIPIFYTSGLIPNAFQYLLLISPAHTSGILFQEIYYGYAYSPTWLIFLAVILQLVYIFVLSAFIIRPYYKTYLIISRMDKKE